MKKLLIIFEDRRYAAFQPCNLLRPTYTLKCGMHELWTNIKRSFPGYDLAFECAPVLEHTIRRSTGLPVNKFNWAAYDRIVLVNGRVIISDGLVEEIESCEQDTAFSASDIPAAMTFAGGGATARDYFQIKHDLDKYSDFAQSLKAQSSRTVKCYEYIWDLMNASPKQLEIDFINAVKELGPNQSANQAGKVEGCHFISPDSIYIHPEAHVLPGSVFDATDGPIFIDSHARIDPGCQLNGPLYVGVNARIIDGIVAGSSIGPVCQVAGEVEESIFHGYVNKHHAGFIGHSYVSEWVNFGAMTTNSDLKNNYSNVRVHNSGELKDTGLVKVGSFIGEHTKFGIGTLLNTGIHIGAFCNIFGGALVADKYVPSFSWGGDGTWREHEFAKAIITASRAMARRKCEMTEEDEAAARFVYDFARK